jgi:hypothetical protein
MDMSDPTKFALLTDANGGSFTDATAYTTGRTIVGNVVTFTGATITHGHFFSLASSLIPGPGGVAATTVWLRADEGVYNNAGTTLATNTQTVQQWVTTGGLGAATAQQPTNANKPTFRTNVANGNPVVRFANTTFLDFGNLGISGTSDLSMTMVFKPTVTTGGTFNDSNGRYMIDRINSTAQRISLKLLSTGKIGFQEQTDAGAVDGVSTTTSVSTTTMQIVDFYRDYSVRYGIYYNGSQEGTLAESGGTLTFPNPRLGALPAGNGGLTGDIAEYIFFNRDITTLERNRIDSYLAIKYGITLDQFTLTNYTASDGVVIYPATSSHSSYVADIAGIGKDNVSRLTQSSSKSANANAVLTVSSPSSLGDTDFLVWGDNAGTLTSGTDADVDGTVIKGRLSRVWRVAERNDVGTVTISFDLTQVPGAKTQTDLRILIDRNGDGFADNDVTPVAGTLVGQIFTVTGVDLHDLDYITVGTRNLASTPLPIQLVDFDVSAHPDGVLANWETTNEINNDFFTLERSTDGEEFEDVMRIPGAGTSEGTLYYEAIDTPYTLGDFYYRLKQTDFDGKTATSGIRKVTLTKSLFYVKVYPNPVDRGEFTIELPADNYAASVEMLNSAGQIVYSGTTRSSNNTVDVKELPKGIYFLRVLSNSGVSTSKLVLR